MQKWYVKSKMTTASCRWSAYRHQLRARSRGRNSRRSWWRTRTASSRDAGDGCAGGERRHDRPAPRRRDRDRGLRKEYVSAAGPRARARRHRPQDRARASSSASSGRAGCGKSTLLRILAGLDHQTVRHHHRRCRRLGGRERHGVPGERSVSLDERRDQCRLRPDDARRPAPPRPRSASTPRSSSSASPSSAGTIRISCPAACASAARSRAPSSPIRRCC